MRSSRLGVGLALTGAALLLGACSSGSPGSTGSAGATPSASADASSTTAAPSSSGSTPTPSATGSSATTVLKDGRYPVYIVKADATRRRVTVDVVQFFTGKAAATAAAGDHSAEVPPPNDYWIRNSSKQLRTLPIRSGAPVTVNVLSADVTGDATMDSSVTLTTLASYSMLKDALFWVTVKDGVVTKLAEQYLP